MKVKSQKTLLVLIFVGLICHLVQGCFTKDYEDSILPDTSSEIIATDTQVRIDTSTSGNLPTDTWSAPSASKIMLDYDNCIQYPSDCSMFGTSCPVVSPEEGTIATPSQICATDDEPVLSNAAAKVTLNIYSNSFNIATGQIYIPEDLISKIVGVPELEVIDSYPEELMKHSISEMSSNSNGFSFHISWPNVPKLKGWNGQINELDIAYLSMKVTMEISCDQSEDDTEIFDDTDTQFNTDPDTIEETSEDTNEDSNEQINDTDTVLSPTKIVEVTTYLSLCSTDHSRNYNWYSSGENCTHCYIICEMVAKPLVPDFDEYDLALPNEPEVEIIPVMNMGRSISLIANTKGTKGPVSYKWSATGGEIFDNSLNGIVWDLPKEPGPHQVNVTIKDSKCAAVATFYHTHGV